MRISDWSSDVCSSDLGLSETDAERLLSAGSRTYNQFTYDDQTDNYQQDHYQALYSHQFSSALNANIGLHLTKGRGYYEELKPGEDFSGYGLEDIITGGDTISTTDLIRRSSEERRVGKECVSTGRSRWSQTN